MVDRPAEILSEPEFIAQNRLCRRRAQASEDRGFHNCEFGLEPWLAGANFARARLFVNAAFAALLKLEMFHGIGNVNARSIDAGILQRTVEHAARRTDEWPARQVFVVARLLVLSIGRAEVCPRSRYAS
jgi:hypothetical protein